MPVSTECTGTEIGCQSAAEIRSQSLQSFTNAGRMFDIVAGTAGDGTVFYNNVLKAAVVASQREMDTLESVANKNLMTS